MYRTEKIGWLALESLVRQQEIDFDWEVIIAEETGERAMGQKAINTYKDGLEQAGCTNIRYMALSEWIPLADKWQMLINAAHKDSRVMVPHAADYFSAPRRLVETHRAFMENGADWFLPSRVICYNIPTGKTILLDKALTPRKDDMCGRAISADLLRVVAPMLKNKQRNVDGLIWSSCLSMRPDGLDIYHDQSDNWQYGLDTDGLNTLSGNRDRFYTVIQPPYRPCPFDIKTRIPPAVMVRLEECKKYITAHRRAQKVKGV